MITNWDGVDSDDMVMVTTMVDSLWLFSEFLMFKVGI